MPFLGTVLGQKPAGTPTVSSAPLPNAAAVKPKKVVEAEVAIKQKATNVNTARNTSKNIAKVRNTAKNTATASNTAKPKPSAASTEAVSITGSIARGPLPTAKATTDAFTTVKNTLIPELERASGAFDLIGTNMDKGVADAQTQLDGIKKAAQKYKEAKQVLDQQIYKIKTFSQAGGRRSRRASRKTSRKGRKASRKH